MTLRPVFIAGCDRSGTTLLGDLLGAAPDAFAVPESQWMHDYLLMLQAGTLDGPLAAARWLRAHFRFAAWGLSLDDAALAALIDLAEPRATIERIIRAYLVEHAPERAGGTVWIDHTPDSFLRYPLLSGLFPDARYIHIVRDGRAVCQSITPLDWGPNNAYSATRHWSRRVLEALAVESAEGTNCLRVRYEDLLREPEATMRRVCAFAGLTYAHAVIDGGGLVVPAFTKQQHQLVGRRPQGSRAEAWRQQLRRRDIEDFEAYPLSRRLLTAFGYVLETPQVPRRGSLSVAWAYTHDFLMYFVHRLRHRRMESRVVAAAASIPN